MELREQPNACRADATASYPTDVFVYDTPHWEERYLHSAYHDYVDQPKIVQCSYCGSLHPEQAIKFLKAPGSHFSGADWKYGWPHKFYIEPVNPAANQDVKIGEASERDSTGTWNRKDIIGRVSRFSFKFYNKHLDDALDDVFIEFSTLSEKAFGIRWGKDSRGIFYQAPKTESFYGWQQSGQILDNGEVKLRYF